MKICKRCGAENQEASAFCNMCGGTEFVHHCSHCGAEFYGNVCPNCGTGIDDRSVQPEKTNKLTVGKVLLWIFFLPIMAIITIWKSEKLKFPWKVVLTGLIVAICIAVLPASRSNSKNAADSGQTSTRNAAATDIRSERQGSTSTKKTATPKPTRKPTQKPTNKPTPVPTEDTTPKEYKNALAKAQMYVDMMHMSKARLYEQLTSPYGEQFAEDAAQYAIEHVKANWKENALKTAETYSDTLHMSKARIYDQLVSEYGEKFTAEEAQYAIDTIKADWKANALATAKNYRDTMNMSKSAIKNQLTSAYGEKFTAEEAQYAIDHLDD